MTQAHGSEYAKLYKLNKKMMLYFDNYIRDEPLAKGYTTT